MPATMRAYRLILHVLQSALLIALPAMAFMICDEHLAHLPQVPLLASIALLVTGMMGYLGDSDQAPSAIPFALMSTGMSTLLGCLTIALGRNSFTAICCAVTVSLAGVCIWEALHTSIWRRRTRQEEYEELPYWLWRGALRKVACDRNMDEGDRIEVMLRLRKDKDGDVLSVELPTTERYGSFDLEGQCWPHRHSFIVDTEVLDTTGDIDGTLIITMRGRCPCDTTRTQVMQKVLIERKEGCCPDCGGQVAEDEDEVWLGGHFSYEKSFRCMGCGRDEPTDFSGTYRRYRKTIISERYD